MMFSFCSLNSLRRLGGALLLIGILAGHAVAMTTFNDSFPGPSLSSDWSSTTGGSTGSTYGVSTGLTLTAGTTSPNTSWIAAEHADYGFLDATETFEATVEDLPTTANGVGFSIFLAAGNNSAPSATVTDPSATAQYVLELRYSVNNSSSGYGSLALYGRQGGTGTPALLGYLQNKLASTYAPSTSNGNGNATVGMTISNTGGTTGTTVVTLFYNLHNSTKQVPLSQTIVLSALPSTSYNADFNQSSIYLYLMARGTGSTGEAVKLSNFTAFNSTQAATVAIINSTEQKMIGFGGDFDRDEYGASTFSLDNVGTNALTNLNTTWARIPIPMTNWDTVTNQPSNLSNNWATYFSVTGNMTNNFNKYTQLQAGGCSNFICSVWWLPKWLTDGTNYDSGNPDDGIGVWQIPTTSAARNLVLQGLGAYLLTMQNSYHVNLKNVYLSMNEPDMACNMAVQPVQYADLVAESSNVFSRMGITNTIHWLVGETAEVYGTGSASYQYGLTIPLGAVIWNGYTNSYTDQVLSSLKTNSTSALSLAAIGFHSYDDASPLRLSWIKSMASNYGNIVATNTSLPIICDEVGYGFEERFNTNNTGSVYENYIGPSWDNAWKLTHDYQNVLNYSGAEAGLVWSFSQGWPISANSGTNWPVFYTLQTMMKNLVTLPVMPTTVTGSLEAMACGYTNNQHIVQILQPDSRAVNVAITGLMANHAYNVYTQCATNVGQNTLLTNMTTSATGTATVSLPSMPIETQTPTNTGTSYYYWDSGAVVTVTDQH